MQDSSPPILIGSSPYLSLSAPAQGAYVQVAGETYYRISDVDQMEPFLISLISAADHWCFITSNGGVTAGRIEPDFALFPYETEDKLIANQENNGVKTILRVQRDGRTYLWEPFSARYDGLYQRRRNLYKNIPGSKLIFEEQNLDLGLTIQSIWQTSDRYGLVRSSRLRNDGETAVQVEILDGWQNLLPAGATVAVTTRLSSLITAYKRSELDGTTGLGLFALSATLTDLAEPSESLRANVAWQVGLDAAHTLLTTRQLPAFRQGRSLTTETDVRGKPGAFLINAGFTLDGGAEQEWHLVADVRLDSTAVVALQDFLAQPVAEQIAALRADIAAGSDKLIATVASADGLQRTAVPATDAHHFANVLFNIMRGGIFADQHRLTRIDLLHFLQQRNLPVAARFRSWLEALPEEMTIAELYDKAAAAGSTDLLRLCLEYLPLTFSRRHGDPSRPWNHFAIYLKHPDGTPRLDYQGNWRDIFQNWEPMALSYPHFLRGMIAKFLNATTADGYNPYRVTREGIEWEVPDPDDPWANIGYWSDHQIIYLQKLLEISEQTAPGALAAQWNQPLFTYANVPYRLRSYTEMLADWYNTIDFDEALEEEIMARVAAVGSDGRLHCDPDGNVVHVTMGEKLLLLMLVKLGNLVPGGGIWMNTQRPEWNDANNALVGKGLSVVTTAYLRRFIQFWRQQPIDEAIGTLTVNTAVAALFNDIKQIFTAAAPQLVAGFDDRQRRAFMDQLGTAVTAYRSQIYTRGIPAAKQELSIAELHELLAVAQQFLDYTLRENKRPDHLYHAYNVLTLGKETAGVEHLYLMLEGQVAILSAGLLSAQEAAALLRNLHKSEIYRADQHSFMLYPNRDLPGFQQKNNIPPEKLANSDLVKALMAAGDVRLLTVDAHGTYHFNADFRNSNDVRRVLTILEKEKAYAAHVAVEKEAILTLFEETFDHQRFTGRSGTFFAYEGLGSIYWHMVSKLLLAVQEAYFAAIAEGAEQVLVDELADHYQRVRDGLGFNKTAPEYGAFPTDPYSHTPLGSGARQPGMTGMVKEEIVARWGELGVHLVAGALQFQPRMLSDADFFAAPTPFTYYTVAGAAETIDLPADSLAFTFAQVPVVYTRGKEAQVTVVYGDGRTETLPGATLDAARTRSLMSRSGAIARLQVTVTA